MAVAQRVPAGIDAFLDSKTPSAWVEEACRRLPELLTDHANCELKAANAADSAWWDGEPFDRILLDAPCSAVGVIRRNPDIKFLRLDSDIENLATLQLSMLENLWTMLNMGGRLVYATCSVFPDENEAVIKQFLDHHPGATEITIDAEWGLKRPTGRQLFPQAEGHDGFYYSVIEKHAVNEKHGD